MKSYPCIGGPYDGEWLDADDLRPDELSRGPTKWNPDAPAAGTLLRVGGSHGEHAREYQDYNRSGRASGPTMVRIHESLLPPTTRTGRPVR